MIPKYHFYPDRLESERLITRFLTEEDIPVWADFFMEWESVMQLQPAVEHSREDRVLAWECKRRNRQKAKDFGLQVLINKNTQDFVGQCGLLNQTVDRATELEVGYHIFKRYWGQGYAAEAIQLFSGYAFTRNLAESVISIVEVRNENARLVAEKNGFTLEKQTRWSDSDVLIYRITKTEWKTRPHL